MTRYALEACAGRSLDEDRRLWVDDGYGGKIVYEHPLACIEAEAKTRNGGSGWNSWEVRELRPEHWEADFAEVFCSENPYDVEGYIGHCKGLLRKRHPRSRVKAFVWDLLEGPLVTFSHRRNPKRRFPIEVLGRYHLPWDSWPQAREWEGNVCVSRGSRSSPRTIASETKSVGRPKKTSLSAK